MGKSLSQCFQKYKKLRRNAHDLLEEEILRSFRLKVSVTSVDEDVEKAISSQWEPFGRRCGFPWAERIMPVLRKSHPRALQLALWCDHHLCGVAVARLSDSKNWLSITHIEGSPVADHPLKKRVVPIVIAGADMYATLVQQHDDRGLRPELRIMNPLPEAVDWYGQLGYSELHRQNGYTYIVQAERGAT